MKQRFDTEYWCCLCFDSREQKDAFLKAVGWVEIGGGDKHLDGVEIAKSMGVQLPDAVVASPMRVDGKLADMAQEM